MKYKKGITENEDFMKWMLTEENSVDENLEEMVMNKIFKQHSINAARRNTGFFSTGKIVTGYLILALFFLTWCFLDSSIIKQLDIFNSNQELTVVKQVTEYYIMIITSGILSIFFILLYWIKQPTSK